MTARLHLPGANVLFLAWVVTTALALVTAWPGAVALAPTAAGPDAWVLEAFADRGDALGALGVATLATLGLAAALGPLLSQAWIASFASEARLTAALAEGARRYFPAVRVSLILGPALALALGIAAVVPVAVALALDGAMTDRGLDLLAMAATLPGLVLLAVWATWHDLARAALGGGEALRARDAVRAGLRALSLGALASYAGLFLLGLALVGLAQVVALELDGVAATLLGQLLVLARLATRGAWLANACARVV
jgi:hypothetical protein